MKLFKSIVIVSLVFVFVLNSCNSPDEKKTEDKKETKVNKVDFTPVDMNEANATVVALPIIYDVVIKNSDPENDWQAECLKKVEVQTFANIIFKAVYEKRLIPYNYNLEIPMTIDEVKQLEKEFKRERVAKVQFLEEWYFDEKKLQMGKRVNAIMLAYEKYDAKGVVKSYKAGIKVYLNKNKNIVADVTK